MLKTGLRPSMALLALHHLTASYQLTWVIGWRLPFPSPASNLKPCAMAQILTRSHSSCVTGYFPIRKGSTFCPENSESCGKKPPPTCAMAVRSNGPPDPSPNARRTRRRSPSFSTPKVRKSSSVMVSRISSVTPCFSKSGTRFSRCSRSRIKWMFVVMVAQGSRNNSGREWGDVPTS